MIGNGLLYQRGYFRQEIDSSGAQIARYPFNDPAQLPIRPLTRSERRLAACERFTAGTSALDQNLGGAGRSP